MEQKLINLLILVAAEASHQQNLLNMKMKLSAIMKIPVLSNVSLVHLKKYQPQKIVRLVSIVLL
jgi:hypothetical protein